MAVVVQRYESMQFTGTNGPEVATWLGNMTYDHTAEDGTLHMIMDGGEGNLYPVQVSPGYWVLRYDNRLEGTVSAEDYPTWYFEVPGT